ncbi:MAG: SH3 domain-containing protein [Kiritimatiellia bacterium]|nr:SH3 domain-containing protein [Kiritimatiellia bacterium]MDP7023759.1 SH3 domain-containing protein [Kiritimatiellia bacterium]
MGLLSAAMAGEQMRVTADDVNVRCGPGTRFEIVCQADKGDLVTVQRTTEDWSEIAPPADAKLWVYAELIEDATVIASRVQIRSGPGISYRPAGKLDRGTTVSIQETVGDWVRIAPPPQASAWISSDYLDSPQAAAAKPVAPPVRAAPAAPVGKPAAKPVKPTVAPPPKPVASASSPGPAPARPRPVPPRPEPDADDEVSAVEPSAKLPVALAKRRLAKDKKQGEQATLEGEVRTASSTWGKLSSYRLVGRDAEGRAITQCYLLGNPKQLESILGRRASVEGRLYWVYRVRYPGLRPDRIRLHPKR